MSTLIYISCFPAKDNAFRESSYVNKLNYDSGNNESVTDYLNKTQTKYTINMCLYNPCDNGKVEILQKVSTSKKIEKILEI